MMQFLQRLIQPDAVLMLFIALACLLGYAVPGYQARATGGFLWLLWLLVGVIALISWIFLMFA